LKFLLNITISELRKDFDELGALTGPLPDLAELAGLARLGLQSLAQLQLASERLAHRAGRAELLLSAEQRPEQQPPARRVPDQRELFQCPPLPVQGVAHGNARERDTEKVAVRGGPLRLALEPRERRGEREEASDARQYSQAELNEAEGEQCFCHLCRAVDHVH